MNLVATRRLPGIRVMSQPAPVAEALPRMDIAVFVGLAASGPVDLPVAVEDAPRFAAIFGADVALATDADVLPGEAHVGAAGAMRITLDLALAQAPHVGETLGVDAGGESWWFCVRHALAADVAGSPTGQGTRLEGVAQRILARPSDQPGVLRCDRIDLDLSVATEGTTGSDERTAVTALGLSPDHPRYAGLLPDDAAFFRTRASTPAESGRRFPLAAMAGSRTPTAA